VNVLTAVFGSRSIADPSGAVMPAIPAIPLILLIPLMIPRFESWIFRHFLGGCAAAPTSMHHDFRTAGSEKTAIDAG